MNLLNTLRRVALLRLVLMFVLLVAAYIGVQIGLSTLIKAVPAELHDLVRDGGIIGASLVLLLIYILLVRLFERRPATELSLGKGVPMALGGAMVGFLLFCCLYGALAVLGYAHWQGFGGIGGLLAPALLAVLAGVGEELAVRGGLFRVLEDSMGTLVALVVSAAVFGLLHALNPGATALSTTAIAVEAGVLLATAYAVTRSLWFPIGLHFGWNFTEGGVFGATVSGHAVKGAAVKVSLSGPDLVTGGAFGPEASIVGMGLSLVVSLVLIVVTIRAGRWKPLAFRMMLD